MGAVSTPISPKVIVPSVVVLVLSAIYAALTYIQTNDEILNIQNPVLGTLVMSLISSAVTFLAGYLPTDPLRERGAQVPPV